MPKKKKQAYVRTEWIFDWKHTPSTPFSSWFAILLVAGVFAVAIISLRVRLVQPVEWETPQASVIHLRGDSWSHSLAMEARAKGPFPSRFEPGAWSGTDDMQSVLREASQPRLATHQPRLLPFPDPGVQPPRMARRGEPVLPMRPLSSEEPRDIADLQLLPVMTAIDGIATKELPAKLPAWDQPVTEMLAGRPWKFLVELDSGGRVLQSVSLAGGQELSPVELSKWLRGAVFPIEARDEGSRWVAIAIEFVNRKPAD